jgi:hypothetical protein
LVDIGGYVKATGHSVKINLPKTANHGETELEWHIPKWSNTLERDRARTYFQAYAAAAALYFIEKGAGEVHAGRLKTWNEFKVPRKRSVAVFTKPCAACFRTTWSSATAGSPTIIPIRPRPGTPVRAIPSARRARTRTR